jgi:hypothetical protein
MTISAQKPVSDVPPIFALITTLVWLSDGELDSSELKTLLRALEDFTRESPPDSSFLAKQWLLEILAALNKTRISLIKQQKILFYVRKPRKFMSYEDVEEIVDFLAAQVTSDLDKPELEIAYEVMAKFTSRFSSGRTYKSLLKHIKSSWEI